MQFEITDKKIINISSDAAIVFAFSEKEKNKKYTPHNSFIDLDKELGGQIKKACDLEGFSAGRGEYISVISVDKIPASRVIVLGLGAKKEFVWDDLRRAIGSLAQKLKGKIDSVSLSIPSFEAESSPEIVARVISEGFILGSYEFNKYKKSNGRELSSVIFSEVQSKDQKVIKKNIEIAENFSKATILARDLVNEPASTVNPTFLAELAKNIAKKDPNIECKIIERAEAEKMGMGAYLAVAKGSDTPPKFIHLEYKPQKKSREKLAIIGKGITFDTGGYSIKPADSMVSMKGDMAGAAAVLGIFAAISKVKPSYGVIGLIAATPNLISSSAFLPDDIVKSMSGKTIEIITTDAEGRLALADCITYAIKEGATEIIDLATLTGAVMVALGPDITGLFSNNRDLVEKIKAAAFTAGEKVWELPLEKEYRKLSKSPVADLPNVANTRYGGPITSALFLQEFVEKNIPWAHLDIAGPAFIKNGNDVSGKGGTGFGVRTMLNYLMEEKS